MLTTDRCDAHSLADLCLTELEKVALDTAKVLSQCYDGESVMSVKNGEMKIQDILHILLYPIFIGSTIIYT